MQGTPGTWPCTEEEQRQPEVSSVMSLKPSEGVEGVAKGWADRLVMVEFDVHTRLV